MERPVYTAAGYLGLFLAGINMGRGVPCGHTIS